MEHTWSQLPSSQGFANRQTNRLHRISSDCLGLPRASADSSQKWQSNYDANDRLFYLPPCNYFPVNDMHYKKIRDMFKEMDMFYNKLLAKYKDEERKHTHHAKRHRRTLSRRRRESYDNEYRRSRYHSPKGERYVGPSHRRKRYIRRYRCANRTRQPSQQWTRKRKHIDGKNYPDSYVRRLVAQIEWLQEGAKKLRQELHTEIACRKSSKTMLLEEMAQKSEEHDKKISSMKETWNQMQKTLANSMECML
eukprot:8168109-Karenia_brevis.AAC.1